MKELERMEILYAIILAIVVVRGVIRIVTGW